MRNVSEGGGRDSWLAQLSGSRSYLRHACQGVIVEESWNELHNTLVICANIGGVITSLWREAERQRKEVYTGASINCAVSCGLDSVVE